MSNMPGPKVVVIGGGIAGLSAASHLIQNGVANVTLLEATERLGGRIHTVTFRNSVLEIGGQWIHGRHGNCVYKLAKKYNLIDTDVSVSNASAGDHSQALDEHLFINSKGERVDETIVRDMSKVLWGIHCSAGDFASDSEEEEEQSVESNIRSCLSCYSSSSSSEDDDDAQFDARQMFPRNHTPPSFGDYWDECLKQYINKNYQNMSPEEQTTRTGLAEWKKQVQFADNACSDLHEIGLKMWGKYSLYSNDYEFKNGFQELVDILQSEIPPECVKLRQAVRIVNWNLNRDVKETNIEACSKKKIDNENIALDNSVTKEHQSAFVDGSDKSKTAAKGSRVIVECENGACLPVDFVIMTPSIGVLKENHLTMFNPSLPAAKQKALGAVKSGAVNKIFLEWESPFWAKDYWGFQLIWLEGVTVKIPSAKTDRRTKDGETWFDKLSGFDQVIHQPNVLMAFLSGEKAELVESVGDQEVEDVLVDILQHFMKMHIPKPKTIMRSKWYCDPNFRGSYAIFSGEVSNLEHAILRQPLSEEGVPRVLFAGEAYSKHHYSTAHGAMETGVDAAATIIQHLKKSGAL